MTISINEKQLPIKEYNGQRVVTFKDIDAVHGKANGTARKRFNENKKHFVSGVDYFVRKTDEARKEFGITAPNGVTVLTESGYLMLAKSFTDDLAWKVQRGLVNNYFRAKSPEPEQMTLEALETSAYHYCPKTFNGEPVIGVSDFSHLTGATYSAATNYIRTQCKLNVEYYYIKGLELQRYKRENPSVKLRANRVILLNEKGVRKLLKRFGLSGDKIPVLDQKKELPQEKQDTKPVVNRQDKPIITIEAETTDKQITNDDCITALNVLRHIKHTRETNLEIAKSEGKDTTSYKKQLDECNDVIKTVGMLIAMGC